MRQKNAVSIVRSSRKEPSIDFFFFRQQSSDFFRFSCRFHENLRSQGGRPRLLDSSRYRLGGGFAGHARRTAQRSSSFFWLLSMVPAVFPGRCGHSRILDSSSRTNVVALSYYWADRLFDSPLLHFIFNQNTSPINS